VQSRNVQEALLVAAGHALHSEDPLDLIILDMHLPWMLSMPRRLRTTQAFDS